MSRKGFWWALALAAVLTGCAPNAAPKGDNSTEEVPETVQASVEEAGDALPVLTGAEALEGLEPKNFGCMQTEYDTQRDSYLLLEGTELENTVYVLHGAEEGATLYLVGGVHGDELAGWYAGILLRQATLKAGTLYLLAPANQYGAEREKRKTREERDLNRAFPGDPEGNETQRIAAALYQDILDKSPDLVLDLHEAQLHTDGKDNLGNSIICQDISPISDLVFALLEQSRGGGLTTTPLDLYGSPPQGSLNRTLSTEQSIPVLTVETFREEALEKRVLGQLRVTEAVLEWYQMR